MKDKQDVITPDINTTEASFKIGQLCEIWDGDKRIGMYRIVRRVFPLPMQCFDEYYGELVDCKELRGKNE